MKDCPTMDVVDKRKRVPSAISSARAGALGCSTSGFDRFMNSSIRYTTRDIEVVFENSGIPAQ